MEDLVNQSITVCALKHPLHCILDKFTTFSNEKVKGKTENEKKKGVQQNLYLP